ncbi:MAG TPA: hypothetical protein VFO76_13860 [Candidatus Kapabacteria bacterium]|nr:hypothetical protein [Candidatus Kapabacteria bacterium]
MHEYSLVSVRARSVVVLEPYERTDRYLSFSHCMVIPDTIIRRIHIPVQGGFIRQIPLMLFGAGVGSTLAEPGSDNFFYKVVLGMIAGEYIEKIDYAIEESSRGWLYPWVGSDKTKLRDAAIFEEEPPIMQYVK